jgi:hypothetical protein
MTRWVPLAEALAHVERCERSLPLAKLLLYRALVRIPTRGYVVYWKGPDPAGQRLGPQYDGMVEPLSIDVWEEGHPDETDPPALINWEEGTASVRGWSHVYRPCKILRVELDWQALLAEFPDSSSLQPSLDQNLSSGHIPPQRRRRGQPPKDITPIIEAVEELSKRGLPRNVTVTELINRVKDHLPEGVFGEGLLQRTLRDWLKQRQADLGNS